MAAHWRKEETSEIKRRRRIMERDDRELGIVCRGREWDKGKSERKREVNVLTALRTISAAGCCIAFNVIYITHASAVISPDSAMILATERRPWRCSRDTTARLMRHSRQARRAYNMR